MSTRSAERAIRAGIAFLDKAQLRFYEESLRAREEQQNWRLNRGDRMYWNGDRGHNATYPPGVVVC